MRGCVGQIQQLEARRLLAVVINEVLAGNTTGMRDQDGDRSDWIELYNNGAASVDLTGYYLTDDSSALTKWQFPSTTLASNGYLLIFASDKNRVVAGQELHTNFKLSNAGEYLALIAADGSTVVDSFNPYPEQKDNVSFGRATASTSTSTQTLVGASTAVKAMSPQAEVAAVDDHWSDISFDDSTWASGVRSVGFDRDGTPDLSPYIGLTLSDNVAGMPSTTNPRYSAYIRFPFTVTNKEALTSLQLSLRFDDGFIAYLNGKEIKRVNFGEDFQKPQPQWNSYAGYQLTSSTATSAFRGTEALTPVNFDFTPYLSLLQNGNNVLSFHGVNSNSSSNNNEHRKDFLIEPVLTATRATGATQADKFMPFPSPGSANGYAVDGFTHDTHFSVDRGFFTSPFQTSITSNTPGASIRYTLDGTSPTETIGTLYTGPITISQTTILRAIAYKAGYLPSNPDTETYVFPADVLQQSVADVTQPFGPWGHDKADADAASGLNLDDESDWDMDSRIVSANSSTIINDLQAIPSVSVVMDWNDLFNPTPNPGSMSLTTTISPSPRGIYLAGRSEERSASFEFFNPNNSTDQFHADAAVEVQGHSSPTRWNTDKLSFQVKFKYPYGETSVDYPVFTGTADGTHATSQFDTFVLDAGYNNTWLHANNRQYSVARYVSDQALSDLQNLAGGKAAHGKFVHLYLNGLYWGLYNLHERPDDSFASQYFGGSKDDYDVVKHASDDPVHKYTWVSGGVTAENNFGSLVSAAASVSSSPSSAAAWQAVENQLDVDGFIDYMIINYYGGNVVDWSNNNWYADKSRIDPAGKWRFHSWDSEHAFPTDDNFSLGDTVGANADSTVFDQAETPTAIHRDLIANAEYRMRFADRVQKLMYNEGLLSPANAAAVYQGRVNEINRAIVGESARWGDNRVPNDPFTRDDFLTIANGVINDFFPVRTGIVLTQFAAAGWMPSINAPVFSQRSGTVSPGFSLTLTKASGTPAGAKLYYTLDGSDPRLSGGGLSSSAIEYTGPITLNLSTRVRARVLNSGTWSALDEATFNIAGNYPLRIDEIHYNPPVTPGIADVQNLEFIELLNTGSTPISLDGVQLTQFSSTPYVFTGGLTLAGGARIVVAKNPAVFTSYYGTGINLMSYGYGTQNLSNGGERIALLSPLGETIQDFTYDDVSPWPTAPDGGGPSLEIIDPLGDPTNPANWRASAVNGGTPGTATIVDTTPPTISSAIFDFEHGTIAVQFSEDVLASLSAPDVHLQPIPTGAETSPNSFTWAAATNTATFAFASLLPDDNYRIRIPANGIADNAGNPLASEYLSADFFILNGDANRDRLVDTQDFNLLAANFGGSSKVFSQGDFDYSSTVTSIDFNILVAHYGTRVSFPSSSPLIVSPSLFGTMQRDNTEDVLN